MVSVRLSCETFLSDVGFLDEQEYPNDRECRSILLNMSRQRFP